MHFACSSFSLSPAASRTPAFGVAWAVGSAVLEAYKAVALYAVFARPGRRRATALMAVGATTAAVGAQMAMMTALGALLIAPRPS